MHILWSTVWSYIEKKVTIGIMFLKKEERERGEKASEIIHSNNMGVWNIHAVWGLILLCLIPWELDTVY